jgi:hypothetical protein
MNHFSIRISDEQRALLSKVCGNYATWAPATAEEIDEVAMLVGMLEDSEPETTDGEPLNDFTA